MTEGSFWRWLRQRLPPGHFSRIESEGDAGVPDVSFCVGGVEGWIELKFARRFPMRKRGVRISQQRWIRRRVRAGGHVLVVIGTARMMYVMRGRHASEMNDWDEQTVATHAMASIRRRSPVESITKAIFAGISRRDLT